MSTPASVNFRAKNKNLTVCNGNKIIRFVNHVYATSDSSDIAFLRERQRKGEHEIREVNHDEVLVVTQELTTKGALEKKAAVEAENAELRAELEKLRARLAESAPAEPVAPAPVETPKAKKS